MVKELHVDFQFLRRHRNVLFGTPILETDEVCAMLHLSVRHVRRLREKKELVGFNLGRRRMYFLTEVNDYSSKLRKVVVSLYAGMSGASSRSDGPRPHVLDREFPQHFLNTPRTVHETTAVQFRVLLAEHRCDLGQRLGRSSSQTDRNPCIAFHGTGDFVSQLVEFRLIHAG